MPSSSCGLARTRTRRQVRIIVNSCSVINLPVLRVLPSASAITPPCQGVEASMANPVCMNYAIEEGVIGPAGVV